MDSTPPRQLTPPIYIPRRFRHHPRRSLADGDVDGLVSANSLASLTPPRALPRARTSTATRRRSFFASSFDPGCPFSFQPPKRRKIEDYSRPQAGTKLLRLALAYCDGGTYEGERYRVGNMLADDDTVYCTERYSCNVVLQHETKQPFTLEWLEIKSPPHGFTSPVSEGVIAVTDDDYNPVLDKIALYSRMVPLKKKSKRRGGRVLNEDSVEIRYRVMRDRVRGSEDGEPEMDEEGGDGDFIEDEEEVEEPNYLDGERVTEFDILSGYRRGEGEGNDEDDKDEDEDESGEQDGGERIVDDELIGGETDEDALEEPQVGGVESDGDNDTITPAAMFMPWPPLGSRRLSATADAGSNDNDNGDAGIQHDCPLEIPSEETEVERERLETDGESSDDELRQWLLRNSSEERRRRRRRREEEAEAEREFAQSDIDGANGEAYMRFQLRDNKTFIVFNPPR
ncbi:hypothetical protein ABW20_dc0101936 [Dactylellina cionopaga]|nr:hypothetical protein ABW20_dc0101936 [Dactylellina cionopaga]